MSGEGGGWIRLRLRSALIIIPRLMLINRLVIRLGLLTQANSSLSPSLTLTQVHCSAACGGKSARHLGEVQCRHISHIVPMCSNTMQ